MAALAERPEKPDIISIPVKSGFHELTLTKTENDYWFYEKEKGKIDIKIDSEIPSTYTCYLNLSNQDNKMFTKGARQENLFFFEIFDQNPSNTFFLHVCLENYEEAKRRASGILVFVSKNNTFEFLLDNYVKSTPVDELITRKRLKEIQELRKDKKKEMEEKNRIQKLPLIQRIESNYKKNRKKQNDSVLEAMKPFYLQQDSIQVFAEKWSTVAKEMNSELKNTASCKGYILGGAVYQQFIAPNSKPNSCLSTPDVDGDIIMFHNNTLSEDQIKQTILSRFEYKKSFESIKPADIFNYIQEPGELLHVKNKEYGDLHLRLQEASYAEVLLDIAEQKKQEDKLVYVASLRFHVIGQIKSCISRLSELEYIKNVEKLSHFEKRFSAHKLQKNLCRLQKLLESVPEAKNVTLLTDEEQKQAEKTFRCTTSYTSYILEKQKDFKNLNAGQMVQKMINAMRLVYEYKNLNAEEALKGIENGTIVYPYLKLRF